MSFFMGRSNDGKYTYGIYNIIGREICTLQLSRSNFEVLVHNLYAILPVGPYNKPQPRGHPPTHNTLTHTLKSERDHVQQ